MRINFITNNTSTFKQQQIKNSKIIEKRAYIEAKTEGLGQLCDLMCLAALGTGFLNTDEFGRIQKPNNWCKGFIIAGIGLLVIKWLKQMKLSREYNKENDK